MKIGMVGLGRMGMGLTRRAREGGHEVVGYDRNPDVSDVASLEELVAALPSPRVVWVMVPSGDITESTVSDVAALLSPGDILIDGGNSNFRDSVRRAHQVKPQGLHYLDIGTSGGVWGFEVGFCLMIGGPREAFEHVEPLLATLAPPDGYGHMGNSGAGHFVKMVHNGIEYGLMHAYAEGFDLLQASEYPLDLHEIAGLWGQGSVVRSWLLELLEGAFAEDPGLEQLRAYADDSGEGRWTVKESVDHAVNASVISQSLFARFTSRQEDPFAMRVIAALRNQFGGHAVKSQ